MNENKNTTATIVAEPQETAYERLIIEKRELDERIVKLNAFLSDGENAEKIAGYPQVNLMCEQRDVMLRYSGVLNERILRWKK